MAGPTKQARVTGCILSFDVHCASNYSVANVGPEFIPFVDYKQECWIDENPGAGELICRVASYRNGGMKSPANGRTPCQATPNGGTVDLQP